MSQPPAEAVSVPPQRNRGVKLRLGLANSSPNPWPVTQASSLQTHRTETRQDWSRRGRRRAGSHPTQPAGNRPPLSSLYLENDLQQCPKEAVRLKSHRLVQRTILCKVFRFVSTKFTTHHVVSTIADSGDQVEQDP